MDSKNDPFSSSVLKLRLQSLLSPPNKAEEVLTSILSLILLKEESPLFSELLKYLGLEKFLGVMTILSGNSIVFPTMEELKETFLWSVLFYFKEVKGKSWREIEDILGFKDFSAVKYGMKNRQITMTIQRKVYDILKNWSESKGG